MTLGRRTLLGGAVGALALAAAAGDAAPDGVTVWTDLPGGPVPRVDAWGRPFLQRVAPAPVGPASVGGPGAPGLHGNLPDTSSASYVLQRLDAQVRELGVTFAFGPGTEDGSLCLARFEDCPVTVRPPEVVPRSTCHLALTPRRWIYGVILGSSLEVLATRELARPLPQDGGAATLRVRTVRSTAVVAAPDGTTHRIDDPRISLLTSDVFACWEFFKLRPGAADVTFLRTWASA